VALRLDAIKPSGFDYFEFFEERQVFAREGVEHIALFEVTLFGSGICGK